jgi:hypothetical protein
MSNKIIKNIKFLIKAIDRGYGHNCEDVCWDCPCCKAHHLQDGLRWMLELEEFGEQCKKTKFKQKNVKSRRKNNK